MGHVAARRAGSILLAVAVAAVLLPAGSPASAQVVPDAAGDLLRPVLDNVTDTALPHLERELGQDFRHEAINIHLSMDVQDLDYDVLGLIFGGGRARAEAAIAVDASFYAVLVSRIDDALAATTGDANVTLNGTFGFPSSRVVVTAEEIRLLGGGLVLTAFQDAQALATAAYLEATMPGLEVLRARFQWDNTLPGAAFVDQPEDNVEDRQQHPLPDLRQPPIILHADFQVQFLDRFSALGALLPRLTDEQPGPQAALRQQVKSREAAAFVDQSAFDVLGYNQVLNFSVPPGWRVGLDMRVPQGYTLEHASSDLDLSMDGREAGFLLDGYDADDAASRPALATLSSRFVVTATALTVIAAAGALTRLPLEIGVLTWLRRRDRRFDAAEAPGA